MKLLHELLGFMVLTGPLFFIIVWLPLCAWVAVKASKRFTRSAARLASGVVVFSIVFAVPFADEIVGRIYFHHLCSTKAGVKVYQTVELPAKYWDERGKPKFIKPNGDLDKTTLGNRFSEPATRVPFSKTFGIDEHHLELVDNSTHQTLGEVITFMRWGGWISRSFNPGGPSAVRCMNLRGNKFWAGFHKNLFKRQPNSPNN